MRPALALFVILLLAACASPEERCLRAASADLVTLDRLIAETRANLARGYRLRMEPHQIVVIVPCPPERGSAGQIVVSGRMCSQTELRMRKVPEPIDPAAEERVLKALSAQRARLAPAVAREMAACRAPNGPGS